MNTKDIVKAFANANEGMTQATAAQHINQILVIIEDELQNGRSVEIRNFGTFSIKTRPARMGRNPNDGKPISIPEKKVVVFKASRNLL